MKIFPSPTHISSPFYISWPSRRLPTYIISLTPGGCGAKPPGNLKTASDNCSHLLAPPLNTLATEEREEACKEQWVASAKIVDKDDHCLYSFIFVARQ